MNRTRQTAGPGTQAPPSSLGLPRFARLISQPPFAALLVILAVLAAYHNSFSGAFVLDDQKSIIENPTIRQLWPISRVLSPPETTFTVSGRPLLNLSLAINYALGGTGVRGYHAVNVAIHILAALTLFGIVRRTLRMPALGARFGDPLLPLVVTLLWAVHPLLTGAVTYVVQRAESLMGLFYLLTIYCFIRGTESRPAAWHTLAIVACVCGMATKEVMVTAPLMVLFYDRTFVAGTFGDTLRRRWRLYLGLAGTWLLLGWLVATGGTFDSGTAGFGTPVNWRSYALTQCQAITLYLRLSVWPHPLVFDYGGRVLIHSVMKAVPYAAIVVSLLAATLIALRRRPALGFAGCWFFGILALTSSVFALNDTMFEHRMYLSLAAVVAVLVLGVHSRLGRWSLMLFLPVMVAFLCLTVRRNEDYRTGIALWSDTVAKRPANDRAHYALGYLLFKEGQLEEATRHLTTAFRLAPESVAICNALGNALFESGRVDEAVECFRRAVRNSPKHMEARNNLGAALAVQGKIDEAIPHFAEALRLDPESAVTYNNLGNALFQNQRVDEAIANYRKAIAINPAYPDALNGLGVALAARGQLDDAIAQFRAAVRVDPENATAHSNLGNLLSRRGNFDEALVHCREAVRLTPDDATARIDLARVFAELGRRADAIEQLREALRLRPDDAAVRQQLRALETPAAK